MAGFVEVYRKDTFGEPMLSSRHVSLEPYYLAFAILTVLFFKGDLSCCPRSRYVRHHNGRIVGSRYSAWPKFQRHVGFQCGQAQAECYGRCSPDGVDSCLTCDPSHSHPPAFLYAVNKCWVAFGSGGLEIGQCKPSPRDGGGGPQTMSFVESAKRECAKRECAKRELSDYTSQGREKIHKNNFRVSLPRCRAVRSWG